MRPQLFLIFLLVFASPSLARGLEIRLAPLTPVLAGQTQTWKVAEVLDAAPGDVEFTWKFGDGVVAEPTTAFEITHTYENPGRYPIILLAKDAAGVRTAGNGLQLVYNPLADVAPTQSATILFDEERSRVWNVNPDNDSVTVSELSATGLVKLMEVPTGKRPRSLAQAADGSIWVTNQDSWEITVLDPESAAELARVPLPYASQPWGIAFGSGGRAHVSLFALGKVVAIDPTTKTIVAESEPGPTPAGIAISGDGRVFVTRFISPAERGEVYELSESSLEMVRTIELPFDPGPDTESGGRGVPNYVSQIVVSPDGMQAWVTAKKDNIARGPMRDGEPMNPDSFVRAIVCVIDLTTSTELRDRRMDIDNRALPMSVVFTPLGDYAFVPAQGNNWVGMQDAFSGQTVSGVLDVGAAPDGLVLTPDGRLLVHGFLSRTVKEFDVSLAITGADTGITAATSTIVTVDVDALSPQLLLGKQVFFNAGDRRMSGEGYMACATCHFEGLHDGRIWDLTDRGEGLRNTKSLLGISGANGHGPVHWSANFNEIQDFERDIRESFDGSGFMPDSEWEMRKADPFGLSSAGVSPELDALAAYVESLELPPSPFRNADGTFTEEAKCGRQVFASSACGACHTEPTFTDSVSPESLHDVGTLLATSGSRLSGPLTGIDTPTLRGVWQTAPYLHDGRAPTLIQIFTEHNPDDRIGITSNLNAVQLDNLVHYLQQIDGTDAPVDMSWEPMIDCGASTSPPPDTAEPAQTPPTVAKGRGGCALSTRRSGRGDLPWLLSFGLLGSLLRFRRRARSPL